MSLLAKIFRLGSPKLNKGFVSDHDEFLTAFDDKNPQKSAAQQAEIDKHARIFTLRDDKDAVHEEDVL